LFQIEQNQFNDKKFDDMIEDEDYRFPFQGSKHLNPIGINTEPVRLAKRLLCDHDPINKLNDPSKPPAPSKTQYENYFVGRE
jgi:hypothetical protein